MQSKSFASADCIVNGVKLMYMGEYGSGLRVVPFSTEQKATFEVFELMYSRTVFFDLA